MLKVENITKKFGRTVALDNVSFEIDKGEVVGLLGPNGAGKTTCMRVVAGFYFPDDGAITIDGLNHAKNSTKIKSLIGYLPENNPLYPNLTVAEYLEFVGNLKGIVNLSEEISQVVKKTYLQEVYYKEIATLSKGFRQRVGLAQALLGNPQILIMDEPTEGLDPNQREDIRKLIKEIGKEKTVLLSSHVLDEVQKTCERVIIIAKGKIVADSPVKRLEMGGGETAVYLKAEGKGILTALKAIKNVSRVEKTEDDSYLVYSEGDHDLRSEITKLATKNKWQLLEIYLKKKSLDEVFKELTTNHV
ncbi:MAG: ATP-binding cassette domain-containing protein [Patescibacteria group bacterium]